MRILLAEDSPETQMLLTFLLLRAGAHVDQASHGEAALRLMESGRYDLLLTDIQMPVMDGLELTRRVRERGVRMPIIALTATLGPAIQEACREVGCDACSGKPTDGDELAELCLRFATPAGPPDSGAAS